jgi:hypothetical protein
VRARQLLIDHHWNIEQRFRKTIEHERSGPQGPADPGSD